MRERERRKGRVDKGVGGKVSQGTGWGWGWGWWGMEDGGIGKSGER